MFYSKIGTLWINKSLNTVMCHLKYLEIKGVFIGCGAGATNPAVTYCYFSAFHGNTTLTIKHI